MIGANSRRMLPASIAGLLLVLWSPLARATVYSWRGEGGVLMLSNDPRDVPEDKRASAQSYTAKRGPRRLIEEAATPPAPSGEAAQLDAFERGFEEGQQAAARQVAFAEEMARTILAAVPQMQPAPIVIEQPAPPLMPYGASPYLTPPFYGPVGPYPPFLFGFANGFGGRRVPHAPFFPGMGGRRFSPFLPHGHLAFSRTATPWMRGR